MYMLLLLSIFALIISLVLISVLYNIKKEIDYIYPYSTIKDNINFDIAITYIAIFISFITTALIIITLLTNQQSLWI